jgi:hypothetical protein
LTAAQALDLRLRADPNQPPGEGVQAIHARIRRVAPLIETDSPLTAHVSALVDLARSEDWLPPRTETPPFLWGSSAQCGHRLACATPPP